MTLPKSDRMDLAVHATLTFERYISASADAVFQALEDAAARSIWGSPSPTAVIIYDVVDFSENGQEEFRCGSQENPNIYGTTRYIDILPNRRIVSTETLQMNGVRLSAALSTIELISIDTVHTELRQTTQVTSFVGTTMLEGFEQGNNASLDNLVKYMESQNCV